MEERKSEPHSEHRKSELPSEHRKSEQSLEGRKSRSSTFKEQVRQNTQIEFRRPEFFEDEYLALDLDAKRIHKKMKSRDKAADKGLIEKHRENKLVLDKRLEDNDRALDLAFSNGMEFITNIRAANDMRLAKRSVNETAFDEGVAALMACKETECNAQLDSIIERFSEIRENHLENSDTLPEMLVRQKRRISEMIANKNEIITKLRDEYTRLDQDYEDYLGQQNNDCHYLYIRMNAHLDMMRQSYAEYLNLLQRTIESERETMNLTDHQKWHHLHEQIYDNLEMKHRVEQEKRAFYDAQLDRIRLDHAEATRASRIRLEKDEQTVYADLQQMRATCMMNSEKFDYNYQILAKKGDENVTVRNQQKRRLAQMREHVLELRKEIADIGSGYEQSAAKCKQEVIRFHTSFMELEKRADRYAKINDNKFTYVWKMNEDEANTLLKRVLSIDKVLFEQQLGLNWTPPLIKPLKKEELPSYKKAIEMLHCSDTPASSGIDLVTTSSNLSKKFTGKLVIPTSKANFAEQILADTRVLRIILRQIAEDTDFLLEAKLMNLLKPYISENNERIVEIDNVFKAIGIEKMREASTLINYFVPYAFCTICSSKIDDLSYKSSHKTDSSSKNDLSSLEELVDEDLASYINDFDKSIHADNDTRHSMFPAVPSEPSAQRRLNTPCQKHTFAIEPGCVLTVFREYIQACQNANARIVIGGIGASSDATPMDNRLACVRNTVSRLLTFEDVELFWTRYREIFTDDRRKLWGSLEKGLKEYLRVLQLRDRLDTECEYLRQQNKELQHLLKPFLK